MWELITSYRDHVFKGFQLFQDSLIDCKWQRFVMPRYRVHVGLAECAFEGALNVLALLLRLHLPSPCHHFHYALLAHSLGTAHHENWLTSLGIIYLRAHRAVEHPLRVDLVHLIYDLLL